MKVKNFKHAWILRALVAFFAVRQYFVWELLAVLSLFTLVFASIALLFGGLYTMQKIWNFGLDRLIDT